MYGREGELTLRPKIRLNMEEKKPMAIYGQIASIMEEVKAIEKNSRNTMQNFNFRGIDDIMNELHSTFAKHKVFIVPEVLECDKSQRTTTKGSLSYHVQLTVNYHLVSGVDGSEIVIRNIGEAADTGDKAVNKAMSISLKYALLQLLLIPTKEEKDPDAQTTPETRNPTIKELCDQIDSAAFPALHSLLAELSMANTIDEIGAIFRENVQYNTDEFRKYFTMRKIEVMRQKSDKAK